MRGSVEPATECTDQQQPEMAVHHCDAGNQTRKNPKGRAALQREATAEATCQYAKRQCAEPHAKHHGGDGQGREPFVGREHGTDDAGGAHNDGVVAAGERLRDCQHHRIATRQVVIGLGVLERLGNCRHEGLPESRSL